MKKEYILILLFVTTRLSFAQETNRNNEIQNIAEELASGESGEDAAGTYLELLNELYDDKVRINTGDENEISRLFFLSDFQVKSLADHIRRTGSIVSPQEIASVTGFDRDDAAMMMPFITLDLPSVKSLTARRLNSTLLSNLSFRPGEKDTAMPGSQFKVLSKYKVTYGNFAAGFTTEKDQGEKYIAPDNLPDFLSGYLSWSGTGVVKEFVIGDFSARAGLGTALNTSMRTGLSLTTPGALSGTDDIKPYTSTNENNFFRGASARLSAGNAAAILFISRNTIDAAIESNADSTEYYAVSLPGTGVHNSASLLERKDRLTISTAGVNLRYDIQKFRIGLVWTGNSFSVPLILNQDKPEYLFRFKGTGSNLVSAYYKTQVRNIIIFGEASSDMNAGYAFLQGFSARPSDRLTVNMLYRNYGPQFSTFYGSGPGSGSGTSNETGFLGSFKLEAAGHLFISGGVDLSKYPWLRYRVSFPSLSKRSELRIQYSPSEEVGFDVSAAFRESMLDNDRTAGIPGISLFAYTQFKALFRYLPSESLTLSTRMIYRKVNSTGSKGYLIAQDINYIFKKIPLTLWARFCIFNSRDWDSRLYLYENDLLYSFSVPALSGDGNRSYLMLKYELGQVAEFRIKYSYTAINTIPGTRDELRLQVRVWF